MDSREFIPVEIIIGFLNFATCLISGKLLHSPEPILNAANGNCFSKSAAWIENGVLKKIIFFFYNIFVIFYVGLMTIHIFSLN